MAGSLKVKYIGLELKNPIIVGSSTLTKNISGIKKADENGAGAIVLKSLFEEELSGQIDIADDSHPEAYEYLFNEASKIYGSYEYMNFLKEAKKVSSVPIIASVNCYGGKWWADYAEEIALNGADAIELNISYIPFVKSDSPQEIEKRYFDVVASVKNKIKIPVSVKIGQNFSNIPFVVEQLKKAGADGVVMFNRYFKLGIDIDTLKFKPIEFLSSESESYNILRWVALCSSQTNIDISSSTGIHSCDTMIQQLLAGAKTVQIVSAIYSKGFGVIQEIIDAAQAYMSKKGISDINSIIGNAKKIDGNYAAFERMQYMKMSGGKY